MVGQAPARYSCATPPTSAVTGVELKTLLQETLARMAAKDPATGGLLSGPSTTMRRRTRTFPSNTKWGEGRSFAARRDRRKGGQRPKRGCHRRNGRHPPLFACFATSASPITGRRPSEKRTSGCAGTVLLLSDILCPAASAPRALKMRLELQRGSQSENSGILERLAGERTGRGGGAAAGMDDVLKVRPHGPSVADLVLVDRRKLGSNRTREGNVSGRSARGIIDELHGGACTKRRTVAYVCPEPSSAAILCTGAR